MKFGIQGNSTGIEGKFMLIFRHILNLLWHERKTQSPPVAKDFFFPQTSLSSDVREVSPNEIRSEAINEAVAALDPLCKGKF